MRLIIVSGLSGAGKTIALHMLEDLDYYCIDNLPAGLLRAFIAQTVETGDTIYQRTAVGVDARNRPQDIAAVPELIREIRASQMHCELLFLNADENTLLKRYSETRRKHPLSRHGLSLQEAIQREAALLQPIVDEADLVIDTARSNVHELREMVRNRVHRRSSQGLSLLFESFAYKRGVPGDADFVFDARSLPNPYWEPRLRPDTGRDATVREFLDAQPLVQAFAGDIRTFLLRWIPEAQRSNRSYLTIAIGCTGGQHRSVYLAETLGRSFAQHYAQVQIRHSEMGVTFEAGAASDEAAEQA